VKDLLTMITCGLLLVACNPADTPEQKQLKVCINEVKLGLNDPNSFELLSTKAIKVDDGTHRLKVEFTAKNAFGGRVRGEDICGFKSETSVVLNSDDTENMARTLARQLRAAGVKVR
jgi:hypothetical protein